MEKPILAAILSVSGTALNDKEKFLLEKSNPAGIALFGRNIQDKQQITKLINEIKTVIGRDDVLIAIDQEGGRVRRLTPPHFRPYASHIDIGALPLNEAKRASELHAKLIATDLKELGINVNFAPCLDCYKDNTTQALKSRCLSDNPNTVSILGKIMVDTYIKNGIIPCIKHLPGHGAAISDPHLCLPEISLSIDELESELIPFRNCNYSPLAMTAHILINSIDNQNPLTQSTLGIKKLIREKIRFDGFLVSDAIDMHALKGTLEEKANSSIKAGCDCINYSLGKTEELSELADKCPKLSDTGKQRLDKALQILHNNDEQADIETLSAEYTKLLSTISPYNESYDATEVLHKLQSEE